MAQSTGNTGIDGMRKGINLAKSVGNKAKNAKEQVGKAKQAVQNGKQKLKQGAKRLVKEGAKKALSSTGVGAVVVQVVTRWKLILKVGAGVVLLVILLASDQSGEDDNGALQTQQQEGQLTQQVDAPTATMSCNPPSLHGIGENTTCTLHVTYNGSADDIIIDDDRQQGSKFISASPTVTIDNSSGTIRWDAKTLGLPLNPVDITVSIVLQSTDTNLIVFNKYTITWSKLSSGTAQSNQDTCSGKYTLTNPLGNFGDPQCNFSMQQFGTQINQLDAANAYKWNNIVNCESTNSPNAYNPKSASGRGAYGLFQMNPTGGTDPTDVGSVNWPQQITNAVDHYKKAGNFSYWDCAIKLGY